MTQAEIDNFNPNTFDWKENSWEIAEYCPQYIDKNLYNWKDYSWFIAKFCPQHMDKNLYNWKDDSWAIIKYCPQHMNKKLIVFKCIHTYLPEYKGKTYEQIKTLAIAKLL